MSQRHRPRSKQSASGPGDRIASSSDIAIYLREDCRTLDDSLQLEMVVAQYIPRIRAARTPDGVDVAGAIGAGLVAGLERESDPLSHAILLALADLGTGDLASRSAAAVARLADRGIALPREFDDVGGAESVGAWRGGSEIEDECALFAEFEHPGGRRHTVALFVAAHSGGAAKHVALLGPMREVDPGGPFAPDALESLEPAAAAALIGRALARSFGPDATETDDYRVVIAAARARSLAAGESTQAV